LKAEYATRQRRFVRYFSQWFSTTEKGKELMKMQGYIGMKIDYLRLSKERLRELESDIDCLIENVPSMEKEVT
tara:strand:+ start:718 stop:936 length:219 start_codon:yes stop_codon:yes gene_type:complete